ncbi:uncharacterized protein PHALS_03534 [Plasmopara halstedii]|uniref:RxLR-like protein n=1 Tax=Plasmopara halstedii TaxID=4781 RepID=A0A0N7L7E6_PLAHL|nr:uncharacterized protein PHALS_03534 [Plasmopara halstedii]CEG46859.1 hypothetical protein PHALS_03534 [Plasmopara halstedii]|eukprot:XP_024583228.1 hypothetical protein PHALS_03534 [Plasmopara halstedii]
MILLSRKWMLPCVTVAAILSTVPFSRAGDGLASPPRQLKEETVKVHVEVHSEGEIQQPSHQDAVPTKGLPQTRNKRNKDKNTIEKTNTVYDDRHGTVQGVKVGKSHGKGHRREKQNLKDEIVVEYERGSVKISGTSSSSRKTKDLKVITQDKKKVYSAASEGNKLMTMLSSTDKLKKRAFFEALSPTGILCGIFIGLAAIIGVAGLVTGKLQSHQKSVLSAVSLDVDVEADDRTTANSNVVTDDSNVVSESQSRVDDGESEKGTFASGTSYGSV